MRMRTNLNSKTQRNYLGICFKLKLIEMLFETAMKIEQSFIVQKCKNEFHPDQNGAFGFH